MTHLEGDHHKDKPKETHSPKEHPAVLPEHHHDALLRSSDPDAVKQREEALFKPGKRIDTCELLKPHNVDELIAKHQKSQSEAHKGEGQHNPKDAHPVNDGHNAVEHGK